MLFSSHESLVNVDEEGGEIETYSVRLMSDEAVTELTASDGEEIAVTAVADEDYTIDAVYVNGEEIVGDNFILTEDTEVTLEVSSLSTEIKAVTNDAINIHPYSATLGGNIINSNDDEEGVKYIRYWAENAPEDITTTEVEEGYGDYIVDVWELEPETTYYYQMTEFGEIKSFTTLSTSDEILDLEEMPDQPIQTESPTETDEPIIEPTPTVEPTSIPEPCFTVDLQDTYADVTNTGEEQIVTVIIAEYDADGALTNVSAEEVLFAESETKRFDVPPEGNIFIWNTLSGMFPMTK